ncbi:hypothetical protein [Luteimonas changyuni]|uniref:hypothetical protein n=1 Tax=Luteimonas sp. MJ145 TaxID=3129234 RepID=UPI0031BADE0E
MLAAQESSSFLTTGTPIWVSILLPFAAAYLTHRFAKAREEEKDLREALRAWRYDAKRLLDDIVDLAVQHYYDPKSLPSTEMGAFELKRKLKAFSAAMHKTDCTVASDMVDARGLPACLRDLISLPFDFDTPGRAVRASTDDLADKLQEIRERLDLSISAPRRFVTK